MEKITSEKQGIFDKLKNIPGLPKFKLGCSAKAIVILAGIIAIMILYNMFTVYIRPNEFGIKVVRIGFNRGVQEKIYESGLRFVMPFGMQEMHRLPKDIQVLEMTNSPSTAAYDARMERAVRIQTSDGFFVDVDVSILYKITQPYEVFTQIGPGTLFEDNGVIPKAEPALKATLGELTTEQFYNSPLRVEKTQAAKDMLNHELNPKGITVEHVLVRYFKYSDKIQSNIEEKKLKDQLMFKNQAEAKAAIEEAKLKKIIQEGEATVAIELEKGKAYATEKNAEKDLYVRKKQAEADLLVKLADAEKVRLKNEALKGAGAGKMVGLKMAETLSGLDVLILSSDGEAGVNPLNLNKTLELFDVRKGEN